MEKSKIFLAVIAILFLLLGFLGWRFDFNTPFLEYWAYLVIGGALILLLWWGKVMAPFFVLGSFISLGIFLFSLLFMKNTKFAESKIFLFIGIILFIIGAILNSIGSRTVESAYEDKLAHENRDVFCMMCGQYLGKASGFECPCPRCGSNRYTFEG